MVLTVFPNPVFSFWLLHCVLSLSLSSKEDEVCSVVEEGHENDSYHHTTNEAGHCSHDGPSVIVWLGN